MEDVLLTVFAIIVSLIIFSAPVMLLGAVVYGITHKGKIRPDSDFLFEDEDSTHSSLSDDDRNPLIFDPAYSSLDCNVYHFERRD